MAYTRIGWENEPSTATPINADNLNHMEDGIDYAHEAIDSAGELGQALYLAETPADVRVAIGGENPVPISGNHTAAIGEVVICMVGPLTITIPDGENHGDTITVLFPALGATTLVGVDYFDISMQDTSTIDLETTLTSGQQLTLRWLKDIEGFAPNPISGWFPA
ncbi:MAG: hypothetical protein M3Y83_14130, partial [Actinomycetota bacterium]|nr:hypothetical protein [Actinomycetota bacterium]